MRRAVSSIYYALFQCLAKLCADSFIGTNRLGRSKRAWQQVYRSLEHGMAKTACEAAKAENKNFPPEIKNYAVLFVEYQKKRHNADYDPYANAAKDFKKEDILNMIAEARNALDAIKKVGANDRKAFAAFILLKPPRK